MARGKRRSLGKVPLKLTGKGILEVLKVNSEEVRGFGVKRIGLFGSFATETNNDSSDIDFLVEFEKGKKTFDSYMNLKFFLEDVFGRKVDLITQDALRPEVSEQVAGSTIYAEGV